MEVAAALLDASRKLSDKDNKSFESSTGNVSMGSGSSWASNNEFQDKQHQMPNTKSPTSSWLSNPWGQGSRQRTMSDCVSNSEKLSTMAWLGGWPLMGKNGDNFQSQIQKSNNSSHFSQQQSDGQDKRVRRASCKGIESAMAGGMGKVWYDS